MLRCCAATRAIRAARARPRDIRHERASACRRAMVYALYTMLYVATRAP